MTPLLALRTPAARRSDSALVLITNEAETADVANIAEVWERIRRYAGEEFLTITELPFVYEVPGNYLQVNRTVRNLSKTNFEKALPAMPADSPAAIAERQGPSYTWAILMDARIRSSDW